MSHQSSINNQQSTLSNQQSTINQHQSISQQSVTHPPTSVGHTVCLIPSVGLDFCGCCGTCCGPSLVGGRGGALYSVIGGYRRQGVASVLLLRLVALVRWDLLWSVIGFMDGLQGDVAQLKLDMEAALALAARALLLQQTRRWLRRPGCVGLAGGVAPSSILAASALAASALW